MKSSILIILFLILNNASLFCQQITKSKKVKIGKYTYSLFLKPSYFYEDDIYNINYTISKNNKEQSLGGFLSYRKNIRSRNEPSLGENLPPNRLEKLKEWQVIGEGNMMIDHKKRLITTKFINYFKIDESEADSIKNIYKQNKSGFFETVLIKKYNNGIENILYKK